MKGATTRKRDLATLASCLEAIHDNAFDSALVGVAAVWLLMQADVMPDGSLVSHGRGSMPRGCPCRGSSWMSGVAEAL